MFLSLSTAEGNKTKSQELLDSYLKSACRFLDDKTAKGARKFAKNFVRSDDRNFNAHYGKPATKDLLTGIKSEDIQKKEKELSAQAKKVSAKMKANYALNVEVNKDIKNPFSIFASSIAVLPGISVLVNAAEQKSLAGVAVGLAGIGVAVGAVAAVHGIKKSVEAKTPEEKKEIKSYIEVRHSQLALKQLKKALRQEQRSAYKQEVQQLFAAGLGNPGGMITPLVLRQKKGSSR